MNPALQITCGAPDPTSTPLNIVDLFALINSHLMGTIIGDYIPYVISSTTPSMEDTDKIWLKLDSGGRPIALMRYYNGVWRRVYNGMTGEIRMYSGDPTDITIWDTTGLGVPGAEYDGWQICNGQNGAPDLSDKFILAGHMNNASGHAGYSSGWQSFINGSTDQKTGGNDTITLNANNTYRPAYPAAYDPTLQKMDRYSASDSNDPGGDLWGVNSVQHQVIVPQDSGNPSPDPISIEPPFIAMGFIIFVGYA